MTFLSIIIPSLNEAETIVTTLASLQACRIQGVEIILADGGSSDATVNISLPLVDRCCISPAGRSLQMNAGAELANGELLLFLHADTLLPNDFLVELEGAARNDEMNWGFFRVRLSGQHPLLRCVEVAMNWRSRLTSVASGDQAIFVRRSFWQKLKGFAPLPLMEDIEFSKRARRDSLPLVISSRLVTSSRRWEQRGVLKTILLMWWLRLQYWLGIPVANLARQYR